MKPKLIAQGIFMWDGNERRSDRYGAFYANTSSYNGDKSKTIRPSFDQDVLKQFVGKRVKITAIVMENRESGHIGDLFLGITPDPLPAGQTIELGIGILGSHAAHEGQIALEIVPEDHRKTFWIDPRIFYRLHDQTVKIYVEKSDAPAHPVYRQAPSSSGDEAIANGDGTLQVKASEEGKYRIEPKVESLGDGMFSITQPSMAKGARHRMVK